MKVRIVGSKGHIAVLQWSPSFWKELKVWNVHVKPVMKQF